MKKYVSCFLFFFLLTSASLRLFTFRLCRVRVFGGLAGVVNLVKAAARSPWRVRGVLFRHCRHDPVLRLVAQSRKIITCKK